MREMGNDFEKAGLLKCDLCGCYFFSNQDLSSHRATHCESKEGMWRKSSYGGEFSSADSDRYLADVIKQSGKVTIGFYEYSLSGNGKWLKRKHVRGT
jgi:hypothetical protein